MKALNETTQKSPVHNTKSILTAPYKPVGVASRANSGHNTSLPFSLQAKMEKSFGQNLSDVTIHKNSSKAVQMKSLAFTQGDNIHFAPGHFNPDSESGRHLIGHEFTHVMQQRNGGIKSTDKMSPGIQLNADPVLEREADVLGKRAVNGQAVSQYQGIRASHGQTGVIQRKTDTPWGDWSTSTYQLTQDVDSNQVAQPAGLNYRGVDITMNFKPKPTVDAELIGLTQTANSIQLGSIVAASPTTAGRSINSTDARSVNGQSDEGAHIDMSATYNNPMYAVASSPSTSLADTNTGAIWGQHGWHYYQNSNLNQRDGKLIDRPTIANSAQNSSQLFETTALATKGSQAGMYYGSVKWGWQSDRTGNQTIIPFEVVNDGVPTSTFMKSAELWNNSATPAGVATLDLPVQWMGTVHNTPSLGLRTGPSTENTLIADIPGNAAVTVMDDSSSWLQIQLDTTQPGVNLNATGRSQLMTGNLLRGYVSGSYIAKDADYAR